MSFADIDVEDQDEAQVDQEVVGINKENIKVLYTSSQMVSIKFSGVYLKDTNK